MSLLVPTSTLHQSRDSARLACFQFQLLWLEGVAAFFLFVFLVIFFILFIAAWDACDSHFSIQQNQCTALMVAAEHGQADCARLLMDAGADKDFKNKV